MTPTSSNPFGRTASERLDRPRRRRVVAGVAEGLGRHFDVDPAIVRTLFAATSLVGGLGILAYALAWLAMPDEGADSASTTTRTRWAVYGLAAVAVLTAIDAVAYGSTYDGQVWNDWAGHAVAFGTLAAAAVVAAIAVRSSRR